MAMEIEHSDFEETNILPIIKATLTPTELKVLKENYIGSMKVANTRPHPAGPVEPPLVNLSNPLARVVDSIKDAFRFASSDKPQVEWRFLSPHFSALSLSYPIKLPTQTHRSLWPYLSVSASVLPRFTENFWIWLCALFSSRGLPTDHSPSQEHITYHDQ